MLASHISRDSIASQNILKFLEQNSPFQCTDDDIRSISSGIVGDKSVDVHKANNVGHNILNKMRGQNALKHSFSRKHCVVQLGKEKFAKTDGEPVDIQPQLLFQRLIAIGNVRSTPEETTADSILEYELSPHPASLFDNTGLMRSPVKVKSSQPCRCNT